MKRFFVSFFIFLGAIQAHAVMSFSTTGSLGFYRDDTQQAHFPLFYTFNYSGFHQNGVESRLDLILNNDFTYNEWRLMPSQAQIIVPIGDGFSGKHYRRTRFEAGRSLFTEGFDIALLDGAKVPFYWSEKGGGTIFGGWTKTLDLYEEGSSPLVGANIFQDIQGYFVKVGGSGRRDRLKEKYINASLLKLWDVWSAPSFFYKIESTEKTGFNQAVSEVSFSPLTDLSFSVRHSWLNPRRIAESDDVFLYKVFASSPAETIQGSVHAGLAQNLDWDLTLKQMRYKSGYLYATGTQEETSLQWRLSHRHTLSPVLRHLKSYGGELWDSGINYQWLITDDTRLRLDLAVAYFDKINNISAWAYQVRDGIEFLFSPNFSVLTWVEVEQNHLNVFDARGFAYVTYYQ